MNIFQCEVFFLGLIAEARWYFFVGHFVSHNIILLCTVRWCAVSIINMNNNHCCPCKYIHRSTRFSMQLLALVVVTASMAVAQSNETTKPSMTPIIKPTSLDSVPAKSPLSESNSTCFANLTDVQMLVAVKDPFIKEIYVLCPNTVFKLSDDENGMNPITPQSNSIFKCGDDGMSSNGCVLSGGSFQILSFADFAADYRVGIVFQGITFENGSVASALLVAPGDITFIGCVFRVRFFDSGVMNRACRMCHAAHSLCLPLVNIKEPNEWWGSFRSF